MGHRKTRHHIIPVSRQGRYAKNIVYLPQSVHGAWHTLFGELTPEEAKDMIDMMMRPGKKWNNQQIRILRDMCKTEEG